MTYGRASAKDIWFALLGGFAAWMVSSMVAFLLALIIGSAVEGTAGGVVAGAFFVLPVVAGVGTTVSMVRAAQRRAMEAARARGTQLAAERARELQALEDQRRRALEVRDRERATAVSQQTRDREHATRELAGAVDLVVSTFNDLPRRLERAIAARDEARERLRAGAYSPFWSAIEEALDGLASFSSGVDEIGAAVDRYAKFAARLRSGHGKEPAVRLPVGLDVLGQMSAAQRVADSVQSLTDEAHKDPYFSMIWEQRRTTAATIAGFANTEAAIRGMSQQISASIGDLQRTVIGVGIGLASEIGISRDRADERAADARDEAHRASELLSSAVAYLREADKREGGTGTANWDRGRI